MSVDIGRLDRRITIQTPTETRDAVGEPIQTWAEYKTVFANRRDVRGGERFRLAQRLAVRTCTFRLRWISGVNEKMRVLDSDDATIWNVLGIAEDRRGGWMELICEVVNPADVTE